MKFSTKAIHVGQEPDPTTGATVVPIFQTSTFIWDEIGKHRGYNYSRTCNPTRTALEKCLAAMEEGEHCVTFASGQAATAAVASILRPGDHVITTEDLYGGTYSLFEGVLKPMQVSFSYVDGTKPEEFAKAIRPETRLVWIESPTNPQLQLVDIEAVAKICKDKGVLVAVDNSFATPYCQRPLILGADIVMHSTTKYINGHSDVIGGAVVTNDDEIHNAIRYHQNVIGGTPSPFDVWLTLRGAKTLAVRMRQHEENAKIVADYLCNHPLVESVNYPGLKSHPQHDLACKQMNGFGGMLSFQLKGGKEEANTFFKALKIFVLAQSLGGVESLACYPSVMTHGSIPAEEQIRRGITENTIRLSIGIEDVEDLIADLDQAFVAVSSEGA